MASWAFILSLVYSNSLGYYEFIHSLCCLLLHFYTTEHQHFFIICSFTSLTLPICQISCSVSNHSQSCLEVMAAKSSAGNPILDHVVHLSFFIVFWRVNPISATITDLGGFIKFIKINNDNGTYYMCL